MNNVQIFFIIFALSMFGGGYMGYKSAGSAASMIMGLISMMILLYAITVTIYNPFKGYMIITVVCFCLAITFFIRVMKTKKVIPAGMLFLFSAFAGGVSTYQLFIN